MKKKIVVTGTNGSFEGEVHVDLYDTKGVKVVSGRKKDVASHRVLGFFEGGLIYNIGGYEEDDLFKHINLAESEVSSYLHKLANENNNDTELVKKLKARGFE